MKTPAKPNCRALKAAIDDPATSAAARTELQAQYDACCGPDMTTQSGGVPIKRPPRLIP